MSPITKEEALDIAKGNINSLFNIEITDTWDDAWPKYAADSITDCWYITFTPLFRGCAIGAPGLIAVSKESGQIRFTSMIFEQVQGNA
jgi:hypothetical protein